MDPPSPVNKKAASFTETATPSEKLTPQHDPSPLGNEHQNSQSDKRPPHYCGPHGILDQCYVHPFECRHVNSGFVPAPPPNYGSHPHPNDPFYFEGKRYKQEQRGKIIRKVLFGTAAFALGLLVFDMGRGYQMEVMRENRIRHANEAPNGDREFIMENVALDADFVTRKSSKPCNSHESKVDSNVDFWGGRPHGGAPHELGILVEFDPPVDTNAQLSPPGIPETGKHHGKIHHKKPKSKKHHKKPKGDHGHGDSSSDEGDSEIEFDEDTQGHAKGLHKGEKEGKKAKGRHGKHHQEPLEEATRAQKNEVGIDQVSKEFVSAFKENEAFNGMSTNMEGLH